jgi:hypothetical protein
MNSMHGNEEERLDALFGAYRAACGDPEASANFMPNLWARIDSRQSFTFSFRRMANAFATAAVALSMAVGVYMVVPHSTQVVSNQSYVDVLADAATPDPQEFINPATLELADRQVR